MRYQAAYKLLRVRADGSLGPLFIHKCQVIPIGKWLRAGDFPTKGYARRPGWHVAPRPVAPHLTMKGRVWCKVSIWDYTTLKRPERQGGTWWLAKWMCVNKILRTG